MNYMGKLFGTKSSLQRNVILIYLLIAVLPIGIITVSSSMIYYRSILQKSYHLLQQNSIQHETVVQERMNAYENVLYELIANKHYIDLADRINSGDEDSRVVDRSEMERLLSGCVYTYDSIRGVTFLADSGNYVTYSKWYDGSARIIWAEPKRRQEIHDEIVEKQKLTFIATINLSTMEGKDDYVILMGYPVRNLRTKQRSGVLVMALEHDVLFVVS